MHIFEIPRRRDIILINNSRFQLLPTIFKNVIGVICFSTYSATNNTQMFNAATMMRIIISAERIHCYTVTRVVVITSCRNPGRSMIYF